jgi:uncharacterized protein YbcI
MNTQGKIEAVICEGVSRFEQNNMGRGPKDSVTDPASQRLLTG